MAEEEDNGRGGVLAYSSYLKKVRILYRLFAVCHCGLFAAAAWGAVSATQACPGEAVIACSITAAASAIRVLWMIGSAVAQAAVASTMISKPLDPFPPSPSPSPPTPPPPGPGRQMLLLRKERRMCYVRWLWWGRFGGVVTLLQLIGAVQLTVLFVKNASPTTNNCSAAGYSYGWLRHLFISLALVAWMLTVIQCCISGDILAWSSLYSRHSDAWRAYYHEMFDYGIREALCCLGRAQYISAGDKDEVDSVAAVLGDLVSYRAAGASHLEFLAGLALLQLQKPPESSPDEFPSAPDSLIREATALHPFAVAAYTGPLLDVGRNPLLFLCAWIHRQGVLAPWKRNKRPRLEGDNWWRGHAAAFLAHLNLPPEVLRKGRVFQAKREAAYFVTVVHQLRRVVVAVRGTETPEDLLTDGLGRECILSEFDMRGLLQSKMISERSTQHQFSTRQHYGHEGIVEAARELASQLDGTLDDTASTSQCEGLLSSLLRPGGECEGYALCFVGHSLGGSIAALAAIRLYVRYPELHVYGYGVLPCLDATVAEACSSFVTSIVYNDEFSSRLSVSSIRRLRLAAVNALASQTSSGSGAVARLTRQLFGSEAASSISRGTTSNKPKELTKEVKLSTSCQKKKNCRRFKFQIKGGVYLCSHACHCVMYMSSHSSSKPLDSEPRSTMQLKSHIGQEHLTLEANHEDDIHSTVCSEAAILAAEIREHVSASPRMAADQVSDKGNACLDAGNNSAKICVPEESEVLLVSENTAEQGYIVPGIFEEATIPQRSLSRTIFKRQENGHEGDAVDNIDGACAIQIDASPRLQEYSYGEMFMPGLIIHVVPISKGESWHFWRAWRKKEHHDCKHGAFIKDRRCFQDIVVSPWMFLDHMPWRCQYALNRVLEATNHSSDAMTVRGIRDILENGCLDNI